MTSRRSARAVHGGPNHAVRAARLALAWRPAASPARAEDDPEAVGRAEPLVEKLGGVTVHDEKRPGRPVIVLNLFGAKLTDAELKQLWRSGTSRRSTWARPTSATRA
jgi:hypothetical protein